MAEIRIERKRRARGLLWLFLALVVVALLAWYFLYPGRTASAPAPAPATTGALDRATPVVVIPARLAALGDRYYVGGWYGEQG